MITDYEITWRAFELQTSSLMATRDWAREKYRETNDPAFKRYLDIASEELERMGHIE